MQRNTFHSSETQLRCVRNIYFAYTKKVITKSCACIDHLWAFHLVHSISPATACPLQRQSDILFLVLQKRAWEDFEKNHPLAFNQNNHIHQLCALCIQPPLDDWRDLSRNKLKGVAFFGQHSNVSSFQESQALDRYCGQWYCIKVIQLKLSKFHNRLAIVSVLIYNISSQVLHNFLGWWIVFFHMMVFFFASQISRCSSLKIYRNIVYQFIIFFSTKLETSISTASNKLLATSFPF